MLSCFNSRSREGSDYGVAKSSNANAVSTRAPVKGATREQKRWRLPNEVSTRAPVKGATCPLSQ